MTIDWTDPGVRAVALDIDGTLARSDHQVSNRTVLAVRRLAEVGVVPILVTGRTERAACSLSDRIGLSSPVISCNGAMITDPSDGTRIACTCLDPKHVRRALDFAVETGLDAIIWTPDRMIAGRRSEGSDLLEDVNQEPVVIAELDQFSRGSVVKVMLSGSRTQLDALSADVAEAVPFMQRSMDQFSESSNPGATKKDALRSVLARLGIPRSLCVGIADGDTDAEWLADIGTAVAVSNARQSVMSVATARIGHHDEDSVAIFIEQGVKALEERRSGSGLGT